MLDSMNTQDEFTKSLKKSKESSLLQLHMHRYIYGVAGIFTTNYTDVFSGY